MKKFVRWTGPVLCALVVGLLFLACEKKPEGKVQVIEADYYMVMDGSYSLSLNAKGKIRNIGEVDVRNVVVTGDCISCGEVIMSGQWFVSRHEEKRDDQKYVIPYLSVGGTADFDFQGIAYYYLKDGQKPDTIPDQIDVYIESLVSVH
jgi:hypothetical protein